MTEVEHNLSVGLLSVTVQSGCDGVNQVGFGIIVSILDRFEGTGSPNP